MAPAERDNTISALSALETELIALKDVVDIMEKIPAEHPRPVYLVKRISEHVKTLDRHFCDAWNSLHKGN